MLGFIPRGSGLLCLGYGQEYALSDEDAACLRTAIWEPLH